MWYNKPHQVVIRVVSTERELMMNLNEVRIVTDSSADLWALAGIATAQAPLKINTDKKEYVDDPALDVAAMTADLAHYKGKSGTSCPSMGDFLAAFGDAKYVFCITITARLSGQRLPVICQTTSAEGRFSNNDKEVIT